MADAERKPAHHAKGRPPRPYQNEQDLRIGNLSPEELAKAVLSGKGVDADRD